MKIKERMKNAGFWVSLISSVFLILGAFGVEVGDQTASAVINAVCSALVVLGIISDPTNGSGYLDSAKSGIDGDSLIDIAAEIAVAGVPESGSETKTKNPESVAESEKTDQADV